MKKFIQLSVMLVVINTFYPAKAQTLDQSQLNYNAGTSARTLPGYSHFQSFTAGLTGTLVQIDMGVFNYINGIGTLIIYAGSDTTGTILQTTTVNVNCPAGNCFVNFPVSAAVSAGQAYCFRFIPGAGIPDPYGVQVEVPGTYAGGQFAIIDPSGVYYPGFDQVFRTYVLEATGINQSAAHENDFTISPNPFSENTIINFNKTVSNCEIQIFNSIGQKEIEITNVSGDHYKLVKGNLNPGIYFVRILMNQNLVVTNKIMISD
jgi:hypothetical protein